MMKHKWKNESRNMGRGSRRVPVGTHDRYGRSVTFWGVEYYEIGVKEFLVCEWCGREADCPIDGAPPDVLDAEGCRGRWSFDADGEDHTGAAPLEERPNRTEQGDAILDAIERSTECRDSYDHIGPDDISKVVAALMVLEERATRARPEDLAPARALPVVRACYRCGGPGATDPEPCPYRAEINGDETPCECCAACRHECARDI